MDERTPTERQSWESSSRFELEHDLSQLRKAQGRLGESVEWIVDTLLLDEGDADDKESIRKRKREALESLAYVRDALKGNATDLQEERLIGEEERKRREAKQRLDREKEAQRQRDIEQSAPKPPQPAAAPPSPTRPQTIVTSRSPSAINAAPMATARSPPKFGTMESSHPSALPSPRLPPPPASQKPITPWNYTRSDFSSNSSPITSLPRIPPPTSTARWATPPTTPAFPPPSASVVEASQSASRDQAPRRGVQQDPLGALL